MVILETERLVLRPLQNSDIDDFARMAADPEVMKYINFGKTMNRIEAWRSMATIAGHWVLKGYGGWALIEKETGAFVGRAGLYHPEGWPVLEVGWTIAREHWNRGFATEAGQRAARWAFEELGLDMLYSVIHPENAASIRVAEKLGETVRDSAEVFGIRVFLYGISRSEFSDLHGPLQAHPEVPLRLNPILPAAR
jgi:RimJ/RimL family protein N-acetyltransferase